MVVVTNTHVRDGGRVQPCGHKPRYVRDVCHRVHANVARDAAYALEVYHARVSRRAAEYEPGLVLVREPLKLVVVYLLCFGCDAVGNNLVAAA